MVTVEQIIGGKLCRLCGLKAARKGDTRCRSCAVPYSTEVASARAEQKRRYRRLCKSRIDTLLCEWCGAKVQYREQLHVDHVNGRHDDDRQENYQVICETCHKEKTRLNGEYSRH